MLAGMRARARRPRHARKKTATQGALCTLTSSMQALPGPLRRLRRVRKQRGRVVWGSRSARERAG